MKYNMTIYLGKQYVTVTAEEKWRALGTRCTIIFHHLSSSKTLNLKRGISHVWLMEAREGKKNGNISSHQQAQSPAANQYMDEEGNT